MKRLITASAFAVFAVAIFIGVYGCGGTSSPPPTKAAYLKQVNKACEQGHRPHDQALAKADKQMAQEGQTPKAEEGVALAVLDPYEETTERLAELTPPKGGEQKIERLIEAREGAAEKVSEDPLSVYEGHPYRQAENLARSANLIACII